MLLRWLKWEIFAMGKGKESGHDGICSDLYGYWFSTNYRIGSAGADRDAWLWEVCLECVHGWCVFFMHIIGGDRWGGGFRRGVGDV